MKAFVLIQADRPLAQVLRTLPEIESADDLTGPFDAIALASAASSRELLEGVLPRIRELPGVTRVLPAPLSGSAATLVPAMVDAA